VTVAITVPFAVLGLNLLASLWRAEMRLTTAMLFTLGLISAIGIGGLGGLYLGTAASDIYFHDSYFVVGHFHFMIGVVTFFAIFAGIYYWFPKMFGRLMNETLGKIHFWLTLPPASFAFVAMHLLGMGGALRRTYDPAYYQYVQSLQPWNGWISIALFAATAAQLVFLVNLVQSMFRGERAADNPWESASLEWSTASPPPHGNWEECPTVFRGPYEYRVAEAPDGYLPQWTGEAEAPAPQGYRAGAGRGEGARA
jgi:cytochrome c oxidase subunit 1